MKKFFLTFILAYATIVQAEEIYLNNVGQVKVEKEDQDELEIKNNSIVPLEWGSRGLEFNFNYVTINTKLKNNTVYPLFHKYMMQKKINDFLYQDLKKDDFSRKYIIKFGYNNVVFDKKTNNNLNLMFGYLIDENKRVGINFNYIDAKNKNINNVLKENIYMGNLYYYYYNEENNSNIFLNIYGGYSKNKNNSYIKDKNKFIGTTLEYTKSLEEKLNFMQYIEPKYYLKFDTSRNAYNFNSSKKNNDSINAEIGMILEKNLIDANLKIDTGVKLGYNQEFLNERKYKTMNKKDPYEGKIVGKAYVDVKLHEAITIEASYDVNISTSSTKKDDTFSVGFRIKI